MHGSTEKVGKRHEKKVEKTQYAPRLFVFPKIGPKNKKNEKCTGFLKYHTNCFPQFPKKPINLMKILKFCSFPCSSITPLLTPLTLSSFNQKAYKSGNTSKIFHHANLVIISKILLVENDPILTFQIR
jgi:hypothetical protein